MFKRGIAKSALKALAVVSKAKVASGFYLAGGTAAALQLGHRLSVDLDFFSGRNFESSDLAMKLEREGLGLSDLRLAPGTLHCTIEKTRVSFLVYPYPLLGKPEVFEGIKLASLLDIALMKLTAVASRSSKKDFIDLFFILKKLGLSELLAEFPGKFPAARLEPYHYIKSLTFFDDAEGDPMPRMLVRCSWGQVKKGIEKCVAKIEW